MDPINRRHVWDVIEAAKRDRFGPHPRGVAQGGKRDSESVGGTAYWAGDRYGPAWR